MEATRAVASQLRLAAELFDVRSEADIVQAFFSTIVDKRLGALSVGIDFLIQAHAPRIVELAAQHRIPTAYPTREMVEIGTLLSYGVNYPRLYSGQPGYRQDLQRRNQRHTRNCFAKSDLVFGHARPQSSLVGSPADYSRRCRCPG